MLKRAKCKHRCISVAFVIPDNLHYAKREVEKMNVDIKKGVRIMLDSGAASLHGIIKASGRRDGVSVARNTLSVEDLQRAMFNRYVTYVKEKIKEKMNFWYITLDFKKNQPIIYAMQKKFQKAGLMPAPVFHGDASADWLKKYADMGIKFMCLGSIQERSTQKRQRIYFDVVFNEAEKLGLKFHGLGFSSPKLYLDYPFVSIDTAAWSKVAGYGSVSIPSATYQLKPVHISKDRMSGVPYSYTKMTPASRRKLKEYMTHYGFDFNKARISASERGMWNAFVYTNLKTIEPYFGVETQEKEVTWECML